MKQNNTDNRLSETIIYTFKIIPVEKHLELIYESINTVLENKEECQNQNLDCCYL